MKSDAKGSQAVENAIAFLDRALTTLILGQVPMDKLTVTKALKSDYKNPLQIEHWVLAKDMETMTHGYKLGCQLIDPSGDHEIHPMLRLTFNATGLSLGGKRRKGASATEVFTAFCPECKGTPYANHARNIPVDAFKPLGEKDLLPKR